MIIKIINKIDQTLGIWEKWFIFVALTVMIGVSFMQVVLRNIWHFSFIWAEELARHLVLWVGFFGASLAALENKHINIDVFTRMMGPRLRVAVEIFLDLFAATICGFMAWFAIVFVSVEKEFGEASISLHLPLWIMELILPIGFSGMTLRFLIKMLNRVNELFKGKVSA
jgi:TRAP-type C4-dicarboxylate transport system permease small subunit